MKPRDLRENDMPSPEALWDKLSTIILRTDPADPFLSNLLRHGVPAWGTLKAMSTISEQDWSPGYMKNVQTGWFRQTRIEVEAKWWDWRAQPWTVGDWCKSHSLQNSYDQSKLNLQVKALRELGLEAINELGPTLVVRDTGLGVDVIVDGSKRACAAYNMGQFRPVLLLESPSARMFFPAEFVRAAAEHGNRASAKAEGSV